MPTKSKVQEQSADKEESEVDKVDGKADVSGLFSGSEEAFPIQSSPETTSGLKSKISTYCSRFTTEEEYSIHLGRR